MTLSHLIGLTSWEQGCGQAFLGDSLRSPRPCDLLACQLASRREDHGQVSIIMSVLIDAIRLKNDLDSIVSNRLKRLCFTFSWTSRGWPSPLERRTEDLLGRLQTGTMAC